MNEEYKIISDSQASIDEINDKDPFNKDEVIFQRKFRFILSSSVSPEMGPFSQRIKIDFVNQLISFDIYDILNFNIFNWVNQSSKDTLLFQAFDGHGKINYFHIFSQLEIIEHTIEYSYDESECSCYHLVVKYRDVNSKYIQEDSSLN